MKVFMNLNDKLLDVKSGESYCQSQRERFESRIKAIIKEQEKTFCLKFHMF